jgi:hypothetical protein
LSILFFFDLCGIRRQVDFLYDKATMQMVTARKHTTTKMVDAVLNSGMVGLGDGKPLEKLLEWE